jgi:hypothetical protein
MIDNYAQVQELMRKMEAQLPIPARPTSTLIRVMRQHGVKLARDQELPVKRLFYVGDEGGISCDVTPPGRCSRWEWLIIEGRPSDSSERGPQPALGKLKERVKRTRALPFRPPSGVVRVYRACQSMPGGNGKSNNS